MCGPQWIRFCAEMFKWFVVPLGAGETGAQGGSAAPIVRRPRGGRALNPRSPGPAWRGSPPRRPGTPGRPRPLAPAARCVWGAAPRMRWGRGFQAPPTPPPLSRLQRVRTSLPRAPSGGAGWEEGALGLTGGEGAPGRLGRPALPPESGFSSVHQGGFDREQFLSSGIFFSSQTAPFLAGRESAPFFSPVALTYYLQQKLHK